MRFMLRSNTNKRLCTYSMYLYLHPLALFMTDVSTPTQQATTTAGQENGAMKERHDNDAKQLA